MANTRKKSPSLAQQNRKMLFDHFEEDKAAFKEVHRLLKSIDAKLEPIARTYDTASTLRGWVMGGLLFVSVTVGVIWGVIQIITKLRA